MTPTTTQPPIDLDALEADALLESLARSICREAHIVQHGLEHWREGELDAKVEAYWPKWKEAARSVRACVAPTIASLRTQLSAAIARADKAEAERDELDAESGRMYGLYAERRGHCKMLETNIATLSAELEAVKAERDGEIEKHRAMFFKALAERPVAPHPVDQMNNLKKHLLEDAEAEVTELRALIEKAVEALGPFASTSDFRGLSLTCTQSDLRRARETLAALTAAIGKGKGT